MISCQWFQKKKTFKELAKNTQNYKLVYLGKLLYLGIHCKYACYFFAITAKIIVE